MKYFIIVLLSFLTFYSCGGDQYDAYGSEISETVTHDFSTVKQTIQGNPKESQSVTIKGKIIETCSVKGCWMTVDMSDGDTMMVRFKDYGFFVPKEGQYAKDVIMKGVAKMDTLTIQQLRHYAEDGGKSQEEIDAITAPEISVNFTAEGVLIAQ